MLRRRVPGSGTARGRTWRGSGRVCRAGWRGSPALPAGLLGGALRHRGSRGRSVPRVRSSPPRRRQPLPRPPSGRARCRGRFGGRGGRSRGRRRSGVGRGTESAPRAAPGTVAGASSSTVTPPSSPGESIRSVASISSARSRIPCMPGPLFAGAGIPLPSSETWRRSPPSSTVESDLDPGRVGVSDRIRDRFLADPEDRELHFRLE